MRVHDDDNDVSGFDRLQSLDDAEFLDRILDARAAPDAGRVDERIALAVALERHEYGVPRRSRLIEGDHAILAEQTIDQCALADVGATDYRNLDAGHLGPVLWIRDESDQSRFEQRDHALIVRRGDRVRFAQSQPMKIGDRNIGVEALGFVDREEYRLAAAVCQARDELILWRHSGAAVDQDDDTVGFADRAIGLRDHQTFDFIGVFDEAARIDDDARHIGTTRESVLAVARQPRQVRDQRVARSGHCIEQRRFPDVWSTD